MKSRLINVALALTLLFAGVGAFVHPAHAADNTTVALGFTQEPDTLNGYYTIKAFANYAIYLLQSPLWNYDDKLQPVPVLVDQVPTIENGGISKDGLTTTIKLKKGLKWSDGSPLTADDIIFSYKLIADKANNFAQGSAIRSIFKDAVKVDDQTAQIITSKPSPYAVNIAGPSYFFLLPAHVYQPIYDKDKSIEKAPENQNPTVFSGPYTLQEWKRGSALTLVANPNYAGPKPTINKVVIQIYPTSETAFAAFAAGDIDVIVQVTAADAKQISTLTKDADFISLYGSFREALYFNLRTDKNPKAGNPALQDKLVRQAIRLAINRRQIVKDILFNNEGLAESLWADTPFEDKAVKFVEYDAEAAKKLLDQAGWVVGTDGVRVKNGAKLELHYATAATAVRKQIQPVVQQQLAQVGIKLIIDQYDSTPYFASFKDGGILATGNYDIDEHSNTTVTTTPANQRIFFSDDIPSTTVPGGQNRNGYANPEVDRLWQVTENSLDPKEALDAAYKIQEILYDDVPVVILYDRLDRYGYAPSRFSEKPHIGAGITNPWYDLVNWKPK